MSISVESLAGGKSYNGLPVYVKQLSSKKEAVRLHIKGEGNHCTCHNVALLILTLLMAAGAAALIAQSGGPSNLIYFGPGIALVFPIAAIIIWIIGSVIEGMCIDQEVYESWENAKKPKISYSNIHAEMRKEEVTDEHICNSMAAWKPKHQTAFRKCVKENVDYVKGDSKILTAFMKFDGTQIEDPPDASDEEFLERWYFKEACRALGIEEHL